MDHEISRQNLAEIFFGSRRPRGRKKWYR